MWSRKSNDNGASWLPDDTLSDVVSPLPAQPDTGIQATYAGDYDYGSASATKHLSSWVDGRVPVNGTYQPDAFTDGELVGPMAQSAFSRKTHDGVGIFDVDLPLTGTPGIECRTTGGTNDYTMVVTFASIVTVTGSPQAQVTVGTGCVGTGGVCNGNVSIGGNTVTVPLTNIANAQTINIRINGVNSAAADTPATDFTIPMSILIGDTNANGAVNASDVGQTKSRSGQPVAAATFRSDVNADGSVDASDVSFVKSLAGTGLP